MAKMINPYKPYFQLGVRVPAALFDDLYAFAADQGEPIAVIVRAAIKALLKQHNALHEEKLEVVPNAYD